MSEALKENAKTGSRRWKGNSNSNKLSLATIHTFIPTCLCHEEAGVYLQWSLGNRQGTLWTDHLSVTGEHIDRHTHTSG